MLCPTPYYADYADYATGHPATCHEPCYILQPATNQPRCIHHPITLFLSQPFYPSPSKMNNYSALQSSKRYCQGPLRVTQARETILSWPPSLLISFISWQGNTLSSGQNLSKIGLALTYLDFAWAHVTVWRCQFSAFLIGSWATAHARSRHQACPLR